MTTAKSSPVVSTMMWRLRPDTLLPASSPRSPLFSGPHRLAVYDGLAGSGIPSLALPDHGAQRLLNPLPSAIGPPFSEVPPDHTPGGRSWGIIRQGRPPRSTYRMLFTTTRRFTVRGCPLDESGGSRGSSKPHWAPVKSVGYALGSISQSYRPHPHHAKLFQCRFRQLSQPLNKLKLFIC